MMVLLDSIGVLPSNLFEISGKCPFIHKLAGGLFHAISSLLFKKARMTNRSRQRTENILCLHN
jgi:hypothetical protein